MARQARSAVPSGFRNPPGRLTPLAFTRPLPSSLPEHLTCFLQNVPRSDVVGDLSDPASPDCVTTAFLCDFSAFCQIGCSVITHLLNLPEQKTFSSIYTISPLITHLFSTYLLNVYSSGGPTRSVPYGEQRQTQNRCRVHVCCNNTEIGGAHPCVTNAETCPVCPFIVALLPREHVSSRK